MLAPPPWKNMVLQQERLYQPCKPLHSCLMTFLISSMRSVESSREPMSGRWSGPCAESFCAGLTLGASCPLCAWLSGRPVIDGATKLVGELSDADVFLVRVLERVSRVLTSARAWSLGFPSVISFCIVMILNEKQKGENGSFYVTNVCLYEISLWPPVSFDDDRLSFLFAVLLAMTRAETYRPNSPVA